MNKNSDGQRSTVQYKSLKTLRNTRIAYMHMKQITAPPSFPSPIQEKSKNASKYLTAAFFFLFLHLLCLQKGCKPLHQYHSYTSALSFFLSFCVGNSSPISHRFFSLHLFTYTVLELVLKPAKRLKKNIEEYRRETNVKQT